MFSAVRCSRLQWIAAVVLCSLWTVTPGRAHDCGPTAITLLVGQTVNWQVTADLTEVTSSYTPTYTGDITAANVSPTGPFSAHHGVFSISGVAPGTSNLSVFWSYAPTSASGTCAVAITVEAASNSGSLPIFTAFSHGTGQNIFVADPSSNTSINVSATASFPNSSFPSFFSFNGQRSFSMSASGSESYVLSGGAPIDAGSGSRDITFFVQTNLGYVTDQTFSVNIAQNTTPSGLTFTPADGERVIVADAGVTNNVPVAGTFVDPDQNLTGVTINGVNTVFTTTDATGGHSFSSTVPLSGAGSKSVSVIVTDQAGAATSASHTFDLVQNTVPFGFVETSGTTVVVADASVANNIGVAGTFTDPDLNVTGVTLNSSAASFAVTNTAGGTYSYSGSAPVSAGSGAKSVFVQANDGLANVLHSFTATIVQNTVPSSLSFTPSNTSIVLYPDVTVANSVPVSGTAIDPDLNLSSVTLNATPLTFSVDNTASGAYSFSGSVNVAGGAASGFAVPFLLRAEDALGAVTERTHTVNIRPIPSPTVSAVSPNSADHSGGIGATVSGSDFQSGATVRIGGNAASASFLNANALSVSVPAGNVGVADVVVTNPDGKSGTLTNGFTYTLTATQSTPIGSNVSVNMTVPSGQAARPTLTFGSVASSGTTTLSTGSTPPSGGSTPPAGFEIGSKPVYYDLSTTAVFSGSVELCFDYSATSLTGVSNESLLAIFHFVGGAWTNITTSVNPTTDTICGSTSSLSPFAIFSPALAVPVPVPFSGGSTTDFTPTLDWNDATGAVTYDLEWADNGGFAASTVVTGIAASQYTFPTALVDGTYFWRVRSVDGSGNTTAYSTADSFVVIPTFAEWTALLVGAAMMSYLVLARLRAGG